MKVPVSNAYHREHYRIVWKSTFIGGKRTSELNNLKKRINTEGSFHYRIPSSPNAAVFGAIGYYGSDPYNIYFAQDYF
jgi:hypothetical protein